MLIIRTGLPGAGKTLNAIREIDLEHARDPNDPTKRLHKDPHDPDLPPRPIYYNGIPDLQVDKLKANWIEWDTPEKWFELPDGAVIVVDEAQGTFGTDIGRARVDKVTRFEKHRHHGWDIHLITQHPSLLAPAVRKLAGKHINFFRPYGRSKGIFRHEYEMCIDSPEKRANFKLSQETKVELDPAYFGVYKSSTIHTHKKVTPRFLKMLPLYIAATLLPIGLCVALFWYMFGSAKDEQEALRQGTEEGAQLVPGAGPATAAGAGVQAAPAADPVDDYFEAATPRVADLTLSAPRYDQLTRPRDFPRPICAATYDQRLIDTAYRRGQKVGVHQGKPAACKCYTQQVTSLETSFEFCMDVVVNGYFDDTRLAPSYASGNSTRGLTSQPTPESPFIEAAARDRGRAASSQQPISTVPVTVIPNSEYASRPWR
ncbi:zonular occludens toxin domain-containing protein [Ectopseudomonas khazarica]|uniref:zonular occludens toxin domain-containing protein n=1 Tax=Ectopseudomonas khazarica TaxID=2502979 RepID=UPI0037CB625C